MTLMYGKVVEVNETGYKVHFLSETEKSETVYKRVATYTPLTGDVVAFLCDKGKYLCIGKVV